MGEQAKEQKGDKNVAKKKSSGDEQKGEKKEKKGEKKEKKGEKNVGKKKSSGGGGVGGKQGNPAAESSADQPEFTKLEVKVGKITKGWCITFGRLGRCCLSVFSPPSKKQFSTLPHSC